MQKQKNSEKTTKKPQKQKTVKNGEKKPQKQNTVKNGEKNRRSKNFCGNYINFDLFTYQLKKNQSFFFPKRPFLSSFESSFSEDFPSSTA